jgi:hypothetical protein
MDMIREEGKGIPRRLPFGKYRRSTVNEAFPVPVVIEDSSSRDAPHHHVVHGIWGVDASLSRHEEIVPGGNRDVYII